MRFLIVNACVYCGLKAEGNYSIERDGMGSHPAVPLCNHCGGEESPSLQAIWARIALADDDGTLWGPTVRECQNPIGQQLPTAVESEAQS